MIYYCSILSDYGKPHYEAFENYIYKSPRLVNFEAKLLNADFPLNNENEKSSFIVSMFILYKAFC